MDYITLCFLLSTLLILIGAVTLTGSGRSLQQRQYINHKRVSEPDKSPFYCRKKPQWVTDKVLYLKALNPDYGCRKIAYTFNRLYQGDKNVSVSKSFVYEKLKQHQYEVLVLRRKIKHQRPYPLPGNKRWGMDLTTVTDKSGKQHVLSAIVDYGTRKCLCLERLSSKHAIKVAFSVFSTIKRYGKPQYLQTDNEAVFKSRRLNLMLTVFNIRHQYSNIASPWQNGRIERLIGTFKACIKDRTVNRTDDLDSLLPEFLLWYNRVRPHNYLDGKTPDEVWYGKSRSPKYVYWQGWEGLLTGFMPVQ